MSGMASTDNRTFAKRGGEALSPITDRRSTARAGGSGDKLEFEQPSAGLLPRVRSPTELSIERAEIKTLMLLQLPVDAMHGGCDPATRQGRRRPTLAIVLQYSKADAANQPRSLASILKLSLAPLSLDFGHDVRVHPLAKAAVLELMIVSLLAGGKPTDDVHPSKLVATLRQTRLDLSSHRIYALRTEVSARHESAAHSANAVIAGFALFASAESSHAHDFAMLYCIGASANAPLQLEDSSASSVERPHELK
ncbi:hypothetical protein BCV70DRAFT_206285 [Testicularia cyperi]|uniref:Uncharacterized protein n=1 Tax=Testicularia cyperi TaxID=1882483 RepID=A0A317XNX4_9BASI|nr:hypothetical protein BCV70DRAFT_206285 [Testicularia cyperi]